jgi:hypothetical protein
MLIISLLWALGGEPTQVETYTIPTRQRWLVAARYY